MKERNSSPMLVDETSWNHIIEFADTKVEQPNHPMKLASQENTIIVKLLQSWTLMVIEERGGNGMPYQNIPTSKSYDSSTAVPAALTMATIVVATDTTEVRDSEVNKEIEIEFG